MMTPIRKNTLGQSTVEYLLILAFSVLGTASLARTMIQMINQGVLVLGGQLEKDLKTGRAPLSVWQN